MPFSKNHRLASSEYLIPSFSKNFSKFRLKLQNYFVTFKRRFFVKIAFLLFKILNSQLRVVLKAFALGPLLMYEVAGSPRGILSKNLNSKHSTHI